MADRVALDSLVRVALAAQHDDAPRLILPRPKAARAGREPVAVGEDE